MKVAAPEQMYPRFGRRIRDRRRARGMTQEQLGAKIGLSRASVVNIEHGRQQVLLHHVVAMAAATGTSLAELLRPLEPNPTPRQTSLPKGLDPSLVAVVEGMLLRKSK